MRDSKYMQMAGRGGQKGICYVLFQFPTRSFITSCYVSKCIILTWSCFVPTFVHGVAASLTRWALFTYYLANCRMVNGILFIKHYFQIKINNLQRVHSIIQESWNIQLSKCLTCTLAYMWWHCRWNVLEYSSATWCYFVIVLVTTSLHGLLKHNVPNLRAQQKMMQSQISYEIFIVNRY